MNILTLFKTRDVLNIYIHMKSHL